MGSAWAVASEMLSDGIASVVPPQILKERCQRIVDEVADLYAMYRQRMEDFGNADSPASSDGEQSESKLNGEAENLTFLQKRRVHLLFCFFFATIKVALVEYLEKVATLISHASIY